jgi:hypothetical protein
MIGIGAIKTGNKSKKKQAGKRVNLPVDNQVA